MSRPRPTLFDYMIVAINPALIMVLIGSLVYFLLDMFYQGQYPARLHYCLTLFIFGTVLISRISMEEGWERAMPFGAALALVVALALNRFVKYTGEITAELAWIINLSLMALAWWCADRLTWDCTLIDESQDASGEGLLQTVGIDGGAEDAGPIETKPAAAANAATPTPSVEDSDDLGWAVKRSGKSAGKSWWQRAVNRRRRPHSPGVWVVYFSLAALPIFGFGQTLIPADKTGSRQYAFVLLCIYLASALGLLLTTSFLSLRRYLRQRRIEMPLAMAGTWLTIGGVLTVGVLAVTAVLPRPNAEYAISELPLAVSSNDESASKQSAGEEGTKDDHSESGGGRSRDGKAETANSSDGKNDGENGKGGQSEKAAAKGGEGSDQKDSQSAGSKDDSSNQTQSRQEPKSDRGDAAKSADSQPAQNPSDSQPSSAPSVPELSVATDSLISLMKWIVYGVLIGLALWWAIAHWSDVLVWLSSLVNAWRNFWRKLLGMNRENGDPEEVAAPRKSFLEFSDPFASGIYAQYPAEELVRYTFEAFEAWGRDNGWPRAQDQTAYEFARQIASHAEHMAGPGRTLAELYSRTAYAPGSLPSSAVDHLRNFWRSLQTSYVAK